ncbi:MAG: cell envelope integrity protein TolA [Gammaproteobacteria bacterium]|nr:cell envelope integrity protein TolA [Gammaproteobacteria bacterium]
MLSQELKQKHFFYSLVLHAVLLSILIISFDFNSSMPVVENTNKDVINATVVNSSPQVVKKKMVPEPNVLPTPQEAERKELATPKELPKPKAVSKPIIAKPSPEPPKPILKTPALAIPDKKQKLQADAIQKQLLADLKKRTDTKQKIQQQKSIESDFAKELKTLQAKSIEQQMTLEKKQLAGIEATQMRGIVDKYKALILQSISQHWLVPHNANKNLSAQLLIRVAPGGMVLDVQVIKSSGDDALDRSARSAVFKASPLPVPANSNEFELFRQFVLKVKPENILVKDNWMNQG